MAESVRPSLTPGFVVLALGVALGGLYLMSWHDDTVTQREIVELALEVKELRAERAQMARSDTAAAQQRATAVAAENEGLKVQIRSLEDAARKADAERSRTAKSNAEAASEQAAMLATARQERDAIRARHEKRVAADEETIASLRAQLKKALRGEEMIVTLREQLDDARTKLEVLQAEHAETRKAYQVAVKDLAEMELQLKRAESAPKGDPDRVRTLEEEQRRLKTELVFAQDAVEQERDLRMARTAAIGAGWRTIRFATPVAGRVVSSAAGSPGTIHVEGVAADSVGVGDTLSVFAWVGRTEEASLGRAVVREVAGGFARCELLEGDAADMPAGSFVRRR